MTFNVELATQVRELIRMHPEQHVQHWWASDDNRLVTESCNTSACIAGWVAAVEGYTVNDIHSMETSMDVWAAHRLGLSDEEREELFYTFDNEKALDKLDILIDGGDIV